MKDRIRAIMENEHLTPSAFADMLDIGRAVISHILNGRNNPSLDVVTRILSKLPYINTEWLLSGTGEMYKNGTKPEFDYFNRENINPTSNKSSQVNNSFDLFSQIPVNPPKAAEDIKYDKENIVEEPIINIEDTVKQQVIYQKAPDKKISKIIIYYSDNTFEVFNADNKPL